MVVWGVGLAVGLCFGGRRWGIVEEGEGVCILSLKGGEPKGLRSGFGRRSLFWR